jgi:hypothetical protein
LSGGSSLARVLAEHRGVRNIAHLPRLKIKQILAWADAFHEQTTQWPTMKCAPQEIPGTLGERWLNLNAALHDERRGFPGGSSLAQLLADHRGVRNHMRLPRLTIRQILAWADAFHSQTGAWPTITCSPQIIDGVVGERWSRLDRALKRGYRGLPGGSSLAKLLTKHWGVHL